MTTSRAKNWVFTVNNYSDHDQSTLRELGGSAGTSYLVFGREAGTSGTPHLQGYIQFGVRTSFTNVRTRLPNGTHIEVARGSPGQAASYCKKDGAFEEFGESPGVGQGRRTDFERFQEWIRELGKYPSKRELISQWPGLYARYRNALDAIIDATLPIPDPMEGVLRPWQRELQTYLEGEPNDRHILFYVDSTGNAGKSWFCRFMLSQGDTVQVMKIGKRDDMAHAVDKSKSIFLLDIPRSQMVFLQYSVLEMLKDRLVFSPKYMSEMKFLRHVPHVVVFCNEHPDMNVMTGDRYQITDV